MPSTHLSHRHQPSTTSSTSSSSSSSSSTRPALPRVLTNSPSNAVHLSRSTARTSRRVRSHWFTHFALNWRRSSRYSKFVFIYSLTLLALQVLATVIVLCFSWDMYCDKPLRIFLTVYVLRLVLSSPLSIYLHLAPRRQRRRPRQDERTERGESYSMTQLPISSTGTQPVPSIPVPTATHTPSHSINPITRPPPPVPPMVYPPPPPNSFTQSTLISWIDRAKSALDLFATLWFIIGNYMLFTSTTCSETARPIYYLSLVVIIYGYLIITVPLLLCTAVIFCLPCVLVGMRLLHVEDGVDMGGASADDIDRIPVYRFRSNKPHPPPPPRRPHPRLHHHQHQEQDDKDKNQQQQKQQHSQDTLNLIDKLWIRLGWMESPSDEERAEIYYDELEIPNEQDQVCAICLSTYEEGDILCRLWCYHHFHKTCVAEWLILNSRCPLCKRDCRRQKDQQHRNTNLPTHVTTRTTVPPTTTRNDVVNIVTDSTTTITDNENDNIGVNDVNETTISPDTDPITNLTTTTTTTAIMPTAPNSSTANTNTNTVNTTNDTPS
ncbi:uncharacterized protein BX664DRAFT_330460 [Halteromyces radiatus]|uniref:uncharacterized protein n=1 Tax=Halteromyces radiatus TaxID=101107 RepID=UPI00221EBACF|nr:uncharacterized protein BX664DRAFT_330460 [Halteromyces radiatus]KAI8093737.1 hypothetical protein BX664DRAFT_330460 [Halteromyces radiatus]